MRNKNNTKSFVLMAAMCVSMPSLMAQTGFGTGVTVQPSTPVQQGYVALEPADFHREVFVRFIGLGFRGTATADLIDVRNGQVVATRTTSSQDGVQLFTANIPAGRYTVVVTETNSGRVLARTNGNRVSTDGANITVTPQDLEERATMGTEDELKRGGQLAFTAYPNPFSEEIRVRMDSRRIRGTVNIVLRHTQTGSVVYTGIADPRSGEFIIETSAIPGGLFVIRLDTEHGEHLGNLPLMKK